MWVAGGRVSNKSSHWKKSKVSLGNLERRLSQNRKEKEDAELHLNSRAPVSMRKVLDTIPSTERTAMMLKLMTMTKLMASLPQPSRGKGDTGS